MTKKLGGAAKVGAATSDASRASTAGVFMGRAETTHPLVGLASAAGWKLVIGLAGDGASQKRALELAAKLLKLKLDLASLTLAPRDGRVFEEHALDLERTDQVTRRLDDVVGAAAMVEIAVGVDLRPLRCQLLDELFGFARSAA